MLQITKTKNFISKGKPKIPTFQSLKITKSFIFTENSDKIQSIRKPGVLCFKLPNDIRPSSTRSISGSGVYFQR